MYKNKNNIQRSMLRETMLRNAEDDSDWKTEDESVMVAPPRVGKMLQKIVKEGGKECARSKKKSGLKQENYIRRNVSLLQQVDKMQISEKTNKIENKYLDAGNAPSVGAAKDATSYRAAALLREKQASEGKQKKGQKKRNFTISKKFSESSAMGQVRIFVSKRNILDRIAADPHLQSCLPFRIADKKKVPLKHGPVRYFMKEDKRVSTLFELIAIKKKLLERFVELNDVYMFKPSEEIDKQRDEIAINLVIIDEGVKIFKQPRVFVSEKICEPNKMSQKSVSQKSLITPHPLGHIPSYVTKWKKSEEKKSEIRAIDDNRLMILVDNSRILREKDRKETLDVLKKKKEEILKSLDVLFICKDSLSIQREKGKLEGMLAKVEEGIRLFSCPKVLIKDDT